MAKILIVDDEESIRLSFTLILKDAGYEVFTAENQTDAIAILRANRVAVAIVDRLLGPCDGMELVEYINKGHPLCTTILISAYPSFQSASEGFKHRLFGYLQKPVKKKELCETIKNAVSNSNEKQKIYSNIMVGYHENF